MRYFTLLLVVLLTACGGSKSVTTRTVEEEAVLTNYNKNLLEFDTMSARLSVRYAAPKSSQSFTISLRMEKDKQIWMSVKKLGITGAKAYITPDRVQFYEKLGGTYFDGDYALIEKFLGQQLSFDQLQNLLLGQAIAPLEDQAFDLKTDAGLIEFLATGRIKDVRETYRMSPQHFKMTEQQLFRESENQGLRLRYEDYERYEPGMVPSRMVLKVLDGSDVTDATASYGSVRFNEPLSFPYSVPRGYDRIEL